MSARTLTLAYRPKRLADIVGQEHVTAVVKAMIVKDQLPPALIFSGTSGSGKTTTARVLAAALNCPYQVDGEPCGECPDCERVWLTSNSSVVEIDAASKNTVDAVQSLKELTFYAHEGKWRVVLLDEAHSMSEEAFNALLKIMEEPPERTVFILLTTEAYKILHTVDTRAMGFEFRRIPHPTIIKKLSQIAELEGISAEPDMLDEIGKQSKGSLREAIMHLDQASLIGVSTGAEYREAFGVVDVAGDIIRGALNGDKHTVMLLAGDAVARTGDANYLISDLLELLRDLVILKAGGIPPCLPAQLDERKSLAYAADSAGLIGALRVLWASRDKVRTDTDQLTAAQVTCALVADALVPEISKIKSSNASEPINKVEETAERPLTLAEMMAKAEATATEA
jgi:DNA polymerase-3 subunit gamma/tau